MQQKGFGGKMTRAFSQQCLQETVSTQFLIQCHLLIRILLAHYNISQCTATARVLLFY